MNTVNLKNTCKQLNINSKFKASENFKDLILNREFKDWLPKLSAEEFRELEASLLKEGRCRDPLVVWRDPESNEYVLIDGHNRHDLANKHGIKFEVVEAKGLEDRLDVKAWMINNQCAKRNLSTVQKSMLALQLEAVEKERAKKRQIRKPVDNSVPQLVVEQNTSEETPTKEDKRAGEALVVVAKKIGINPETVRQVKKVMASEDEDLKQKMLDQKISVKAAFGQIRKQDRKEKLKTKAWPEGKYRIIYADPPWSYELSKPGHGDAEDHYNTMSLEEICGLPVADLADEDAVLFLWTTAPILEKSFQVINSWGFRYTAQFIWDKVKHNMGHYNSVRHELLLIATKGSCTPDNVQLFDSVQSIERTSKHSEKPKEFREIIETLYKYGRKLELFARKKVEGWQTWGNDVSLHE